MESIELRLGRSEIFDQLVHGGSLPECGNVVIATKDKGTDQGNPIVVIAFDVQLPDGSVRKAQTVTTVRLLQMTLAALRGRYGDV